MPTFTSRINLPLDARLRWAAGVLGTTVVGLVWGLAEPRGPVTGWQAAILIGSSVAVGWLGGRVTASRRAAAVLAVAFILGFEIGRLGCRLPTVATFDPSSAFGVIAIVLGRLVPWLSAAIPLAIGVGWGAPRRVGRRPIALVALTVASALLAGWLVLPATTEPVRAPGGLAELVEVNLGGHPQWIQVRGTNRDNPVMLYLSGGPGQSDLAYSRVLLEPLLDQVTIVGWDQRGTGKSYPSLDAASLTPARAVDDVVELARLLTRRFHQERIYLLGESWGSLLGVLAVQRAPELFAGYIGSGQMVDVLETDEAIYAGLVAAATSDGDQALVAELNRLGPPPYPSVLDYGRIMTLYPRLEGSYVPPADYRERAARGGVGPLGILGAEYSPVEKLNVVRGLMDMFSVMYPQLQDIDLRRSVTRLEVPIFILCGDHELTARSDLARGWYGQVSAPDKHWFQLPQAGHAVAFEHIDVLREIFRAQTKVER